jgi:hypothetical protein
MIAALFSNPNWDGEESNRSSHITSLNEHFNRAIELIYHPEGIEPDIDWKNNPFWAAAKRGLEKTRTKYGIDDKPMGEVVENDFGLDKKQIQARIESRKYIDQV